ncbi:mfs-type transporter slc18b1 [Stylonychia lemnae]|uniref:Mfs-type transporter slc18b1 n=1 Tax=Stylonychia lemnae TaxID=5949 RepID=A0A078AG65_STYLE|nr:mfs-type transporter slc18b1 [Stylonychia lemnae]|eukprot:CDW81300.1 mfs-type transporter slc18b1 [Stylonychia lemnae]
MIRIGCIFNAIAAGGFMSLEYVNSVQIFHNSKFSVQFSWALDFVQELFKGLLLDWFGSVVGLLISSFLSYLVGYQGPFAFCEKVMKQRKKSMVMNKEMVIGFQANDFYQIQNDDFEIMRNNQIVEIELSDKNGKKQKEETVFKLRSKIERVDTENDLDDKSINVDIVKDIEDSPRAESLMNNSGLIIDDQNDKLETSIPKDRVHYLHILQSPRGLMACLDIILCCQMFTFCDTSLPYYLEEEFGFNPSIVCLVFVAQSIAFVITCLFASKLTKRFNLMLCIIIAQVIQGVSAQLIGPNQMIQLPKLYWLTILGLLINGGASSMTIIPPYKQLEIALFEFKGKNFDHEAIKDTVSGGFNALYDLGATTGPVFGYYVTALTDFTFTSNLQGYLLFFVSLIQLLFFYIPEKLEENRNKVIKIKPTTIASEQNLREQDIKRLQQRMKDQIDRQINMTQ